MNTHAHDLIKSVLTKTSHLTSGISFVVVAGPEGVGKTAMIDALVQQSLGSYIYQDYFALRDMSRVLGKDHKIRVQQTKADATIKRDDGSIYENLGARDLVEWLYYAPAGTHKVALIERIERMNTTGLNALLKSFEEPLEGRLIIATTSDDTQLIDTIRSRAMIVHVGRVTDNNIAGILAQDYPELSSIEQKMIVEYAQGRTGVAHDLATDAERRAVIQSVYQALTKAYSTGDLIGAFSAMKQWLAGVGSLQSLLDLIQRICAGGTDGIKNNGSQGVLMQRCVDAKQISQANVNDESVAFRVSLAFYQQA